jgi:hypothetical protein
MGREALANHRRVLPVEEGQRRMLLRVVEGNPLDLMLLSKNKLTLEVKGRRHRPVRHR